MSRTILDPTGELQPVERPRAQRPASLDGLTVGLLVCHAGGGAGLFSAIIGGWASGAVGSAPVTREVLA